MIEKEEHFWVHDFRAVLHYGIELSYRAALDLSAMTGLGVKDVDWYIVPQANPSMFRTDMRLRSRLDFPQERVYMNAAETGNIGSAGMFLALDHMNRKGLLSQGQTLVIIGGDISQWLYAGAVVRWGI
jgi:3-oxoacyl-[acyl-carrier-protein] synthase III